MSRSTGGPPNDTQRERDRDVWREVDVQRYRSRWGEWGCAGCFPSAVLAVVALVAIGLALS